MSKATLATPLYLSFAWTLMVSYQMFTQTAVSSIIAQINMFWPLVGTWLSSKIDMVVFIYAFAWIFVLSSVIPSLILGKGSSVLLQFIVCLTATFLAFFFSDALGSYITRPIEDLFSVTAVFQNPFLATIYLSMPYVLMLTLDILSKRKRNNKERQRKLVTDHVEHASLGE